jgi:Multicopper oxidase
MSNIRLTTREAVALTGLGAVAAAWLPRSVAAQPAHEGHGQMGHGGHDMGSAQPEEPPPSAQDWLKIVKGTQHPSRTIEPGEEVAPGEPGRDYTPVITPNGLTLPYKIVDGVKVFHLIAGEVTHELAPGLKLKLWGFNGRVHGPIIEAVEGDRIRIYVTNRLPEATSIHWHGIILPSGMDGVGGLSQKPIKPGETFKYEYPLVQHGTHMYMAAEEMLEDLRNIGLTDEHLAPIQGDRKAISVAHRAVRLQGHKVRSIEEVLGAAADTMRTEFGIPRPGDRNGSQPHPTSTDPGHARERMTRKELAQPQPRHGGVRATAPQPARPKTALEASTPLNAQDPNPLRAASRKGIGSWRPQSTGRRIPKVSIGILPHSPKSSARDL